MPKGQVYQSPLKAARGTGSRIFFQRNQADVDLSRELQNRQDRFDTQSTRESLPDYRSAPSTRSTSSRHVSARQLRKYREQQLKKRFWLFEQPKDDEAAENAKLGVKEYKYEDIEKSSAKLDPSFRGITTFDAKKQTRSDRQPRARHEDEPASAAQKPAELHGAHQEPELSFGDLLAPIPAANAQDAGSEVNIGLQEMLALPGLPQSAKNPSQPDSRGPTEMPTTSFDRAGAANLLRTSPDTSRTPLNPLVGRSVRSTMPSSLGLPDRPSAGRSTPTPFMSAPSMNNRQSRVTGFSSLPTPAFKPPPRPLWSPSTSKGPPKRRL